MLQLLKNHLQPDIHITVIYKTRGQQCSCYERVTTNSNQCHPRITFGNAPQVIQSRGKNECAKDEHSARWQGEACHLEAGKD